VGASRLPAAFAGYESEVQDAIIVARGVFRGEVRLSVGVFEPSTIEDAEEIVASALGFLFGLLGVTDEALAGVCSVLAAETPAASILPADGRVERLLAKLRSVRWTRAMLGLFRAIAIQRAIPRLSIGPEKTGAIPIGAPDEAVIGQMTGPNGRRAGFVLPARSLPRPVLDAAERERIAQALAELLVRVAEARRQ
jgi:hypothetical protein